MPFSYTDECTLPLFLKTPFLKTKLLEPELNCVDFSVKVNDATFFVIIQYYNNN